MVGDGPHNCCPGALVPLADLLVGSLDESNRSCETSGLISLPLSPACCGDPGELKDDGVQLGALRFCESWRFGSLIKLGLGGNFSKFN